MVDQKVLVILHRIANALERIVELAEEEKTNINITADEEWTPTDYNYGDK